MTAVAAVELAAGDGAILRGQLWAGDDAWVVLLHAPGDAEDLDRWAPLVQALLAHGWSVLAVDLRGHGASDGAWDAALVEKDVATLVGFARTRGGAFVAVAAAAASAIAALHSTAVTRADALVLLSPPLGSDESPATLRGSGEAKLFVVGGGDRAARTGAERLCQAAIGWVLLVNLPTAEQGTALLWGPVATHLKEHVVGFLAEQRFLADRRPGRRDAGRRDGRGPAPAGSAESKQRRDA